LTKLGRVYRLRGLAIKGFRGLAIIDLMNRILPMTLECQVELLEEEFKENQKEGRDLKRRIAAIERLIIFQKSEAAEGEVEEPPPIDEPDRVSLEESSE
jgi:voltage-gated potassium channel